MTATRILIGPFERRVFAEGLKTLLEDETGYTVATLPEGADLARHLSAETPTVLILEARPGLDPAALQPTSPAVAVILVSSEGADVQIALRQLDPARLRSAIALAEQSAHPKMIALSADRPSQPPCIIPQFRHAGRSAVAPVIDWLDAAFAAALDRLAAARGRADSGFGGDLAMLRHGLVGEARITEEELDRRFEAMAAAPLWQQRLFRTFALAPEELRLLAIAAAPDLDRRYGQVIGLLQNDYAQPRPHASTLARMLAPDLIGADIEALLGSRRLMARFRMIRPHGENPDAGLCVTPALLELMRGERVRRGRDWQLDSAALPADPDLTDRISALYAAVPGPVMLVAPGAPDGAAAVAAAHLALGRPVLRYRAVALDGLPPASVAPAVIDIAIRARLHDAALMIEDVDTLDPRSRMALMAVDLDGLTDGLILVGALSGPGAAVPVAVAAPDAPLRAARWRAAARDHGLSITDGAARALSAKLNYPLADIDAVARLAAGRSRAGAPDPAEQLLSEAARYVSRAHAPRTVRRPPCLYRWSDIVLPPSIEATVRAIPRHVLDGPRVLDEWGYGTRLSYGRGIGALFSGPSGTGKTMTAQIIARELGVDLMQVELSRCVSKYIGETEKNIDACFEAAEAASALLLFDEADAMFGKRTEIKDAHDRHANVEVAYLLQRIEAYQGLVILTTNLKSNIDKAFLRRLRFVLDYPMPGPEERAAIWDRAIPPGAPCAPDLDVSFLARRLELSGGSIQSIAVNAAFAAAAEDAAIGLHHVVEATRAELRKMGMLTAERALPEVPRPDAPLIEARIQ
ncbi:AAA family ATPase [Rhodobacterales bacterium HKCCE3408]|nr:AAA family ATPase [Rhodobacterales bacterium HKCCE3408]